jgi:hypothetical protein
VAGSVGKTTSMKIMTPSSIFTEMLTGVLTP